MKVFRLSVSAIKEKGSQFASFSEDYQPSTPDKRKKLQVIVQHILHDNRNFTNCYNN